MDIDPGGRDADEPRWLSRCGIVAGVGTLAGIGISLARTAVPGTRPYVTSVVAFVLGRSDATRGR
ncbi:hypothetical protein DQW50_05570 [Halorubrum sp. 48-1-W]|uniref:hypothetical protein n=1 Tax=Halorubrum sp. 48-1-W TaxID=2249761 RepID=UPI000DCE111E|nr:hypothetical protein [Halorubrum sp. 48-1-W]RAW46236.1 hypothetical protein DQW50_05570 [Halorubrum sp. 48-1-W]